MSDGETTTSSVFQYSEEGTAITAGDQHGRKQILWQGGGRMGGGYHHPHPRLGTKRQVRWKKEN